jgi:hypothetical protein
MALELNSRVRVVTDPSPSGFFLGLAGTIDAINPGAVSLYRVWFDAPGTASRWFRAEELELLPTANR